MASVKLYTMIFVALTALTTVQFGLEVTVLEEAYWPILVVILTISTIKALAVAGWFMHMFDEPRSIAYVAFVALLCVIALIAGAGFSIQ